MHTRALAAKALTPKELDRLDEAMDWARRAAAAPEAPEPHNSVGQVSQAMGQFEPALAAYDRVAALPGPAQMDAIANRGSLFMEFGRRWGAAGHRGGGSVLPQIGLAQCEADSSSPPLPARPERPQKSSRRRSATRPRPNRRMRGRRRGSFMPGGAAKDAAAGCYLVMSLGE